MCWNISRVLDALSLGPTLGPPSRRFETSPGTQGEVAARAVLTARWPSCAPIHGVAFKSNTSIQPLSSAKKTFDLANIFARRFQKKGERESERNPVYNTGKYLSRGTSFKLVPRPIDFVFSFESVERTVFSHSLTVSWRGYSVTRKLSYFYAQFMDNSYCRSSLSVGSYSKYSKKHCTLDILYFAHFLQFFFI